MDPLFQASQTYWQSQSAQGLQQPHLPLERKRKSLTKLNSFETFLYKIPSYKVDKMKDELTPTVIGLGVFHGKLDSNFQATKLHYLNDFLDRCDKPIELYWKKLEEMESKIINFYLPRPNIPREELLETMLVDGGFLLELFLKHEEYLNDRRLRHNFGEVYKYIPEHVMRTLKRDLLKYENQIPFEVVQLVWGIQHDQLRPSLKHLHKICMNFFGIEVPNSMHLEMVDHTPKHLLGIYYSIHVFKHPPKAHAPDALIEPDEPDAVVIIEPGLQVPIKKTFTSLPTASNLKEYGVKFKKSSNENETWVQFSKETLELPYFKLDEMERCIIANFVIHEQVIPDRKPISTLCSLLNWLIRDDDDVNILAKKGIIDNISGNDKNVAEFFSHVCIDVEIGPKRHYLTCVVESVNDHFHSQLQRWWATFLREFFKSPWSYVIVAYGLISAFFNIMRFVWQWQVREHKSE